MKQNTAVLVLVVALVFGVGGFFAGKYMGNTSGTSRFAGQGNRGFGSSGTFGAGARGGNRPVTGQILSSDAQSITVKLADGSTKIVLLTGSTQINQATAATKDDLKTGTTIAAFGVTNADGSVTAQSVQINPQEMRRTVSPTPGK